MQGMWLLIFGKPYVEAALLNQKVVKKISIGTGNFQIQLLGIKFFTMFWIRLSRMIFELLAEIVCLYICNLLMGFINMLVTQVCFI